VQHIASPRNTLSNCKITNDHDINNFPNLNARTAPEQQQQQQQQPVAERITCATLNHIAAAPAPSATSQPCTANVVFGGQ